MGTFTVATGLGMFAFGLVCIGIAATAFFIIVNKIEKNKKEEEQKKKMERIFN
tara:strand:+ start:271 stop:429 length:159 start_codon:yes stop_codon:yes gene_type:complete